MFWNSLPYNFIAASVTKPVLGGLVSFPRYKKERKCVRWIAPAYYGIKKIREFF